jgi:recombination protein RecA
MRNASDLESLELLRTDTFLDSFVGGLPSGRVTEIWGKWSSGKSSLALQIVAGLQKEKKKCVWVSIEGFDAKYATSIGVDTKKLGFIAHEFSEDALDEALKELRTGNHDVIIVDSIGAITPKAEMEKSVGEITMAGQSKVIARFLRNIAPLHTMGNKTAVVVLNQQTMNFNTGRAMPRGGEAAGHFKDLSIRLSPTGTTIKESGVIVGKEIEAKVDKSKIFGVPERKSRAIDFIFGKGFDASNDLLEEALLKGIITKDGSHFFFNGEKIAYGMPKMRAWMEEHSEEIKSLL